MEREEYKRRTAWLARYQTELRRERFLEGELETLRSDATRMTACLSGMPGRGPDPDRLPRMAEKTAEMQQKIAEQLESCMACRYEITQAIASVGNPARQEVLRRRYILGQTFPEIADEMGLVERRIYQLHRGGVEGLRPDALP